MMKNLAVLETELPQPSVALNVTEATCPQVPSPSWNAVKAGSVCIQVMAAHVVSVACSLSPFKLPKFELYEHPPEQALEQPPEQVS